MKININTIITLDNQEQYMVLNETNYEEYHYFLVMGLDSKKEPDASKVAIFQEDVSDQDIYVIKIDDSDLIITLTNLFKSQI